MLYVVIIIFYRNLLGYDYVVINDSVNLPGYHWMLFGILIALVFILIIVCIFVNDTKTKVYWIIGIIVIAFIFMIQYGLYFVRLHN